MADLSASETPAVPAQPRSATNAAVALAQLHDWGDSDDYVSIASMSA